MPAQGDKVKWTDITSIYSQLNTARSKYGFAQITPTSRQNQITKIEDITSINSFIAEMASNKNLASVAQPITPPTRGSLMKPSFLSNLSTTITSIQNSDSFGDSSFGNSSFGDSSFGDSSFGNSSFGNSGFGDSSWGNSGFSNSGWGFGDSSWGFGNSGFGFGNSSFGFFGSGDGSHRGYAWG